MKAQDWLGRKVKVIIDRPLGTRHPEYENMVYPVNYGYLPQTKSEWDDEEIDAYVLGPDKPVESYSGRVVAVVVRRADEFKLVVSNSKALSREEIERQIGFQEKYFQSEIILYNNLA